MHNRNKANSGSIRDTNSASANLSECLTERTFKCELIGNRGVGRLTLLKKFKNELSQEHYLEAHKNNDWRELRFNINGILAKMRVWYSFPDQYKNHRRSGHNSSFQATIAIFDFSDRESLNDLEKTLSNIRRSQNNCPIILVGNKSDVPCHTIAITDEDVEDFIKRSKHTFDSYYKTCALTGHNVNNVFNTTIALLMDRFPLKHKVKYEERVLRSRLITNLTNYVTRIESQTSSQAKPNFAYKFWFFKNSRSLNRKANYLLAKELLNRIQKATANDTVASIFSDISGLRNKIITTHGIHLAADYKDRGINSKELNAILGKVRETDVPANGSRMHLSR